MEDNSSLKESMERENNNTRIDYNKKKVNKRKKPANLSYLQNDARCFTRDPSKTKKRTKKFLRIRKEYKWKMSDLL